MAKLSNGTLYGSMGSTGCNAKADEGRIDASNVEVLNGLFTQEQAKVSPESAGTLHAG